MIQQLIISIPEFRAHQRAQNAHLLTRPITQHDLDTMNEQTTDNSPESRIYMSRLNQLISEKKQNGSGDQKQDGGENKDGDRKLFRKDGRPLNVNQAGIDFRLEDEEDRFVLTVFVYK